MKKVLSLVLVAVLAIGMSVSAFAAWNAKDDAGEQKLQLGYSGEGYTKAEFDDAGSTIEFADDILARDEVTVKLNLTRAMFGDTAAGADNKNLTAAEIRQAKIVGRTQVKGGSKVIVDASINTSKGRFDVEFVDEWVSTKSQDFEIFCYLTIDGKRQDDDKGVTIVGTLTNNVVAVYEDYDYVYLGDQDVAEAEDFIGKIEADLGNGVSIFTKFFKGKKYYGTASRDADEADDVVFAKYPDVDNVVTLKTVGLNSTGDIVKLDTDYSGYFVYDADMNYLGQASDMLPYSTKYYLANKKLDIVDEVDDTDPADEAPEPADDGEEDEDPAGTNPDSGGDGEAAPNANANPGTGR